jgi:hypothetical protein
MWTMSETVLEGERTRVNGLVDCAMIVAL